MRVSNGKKLRFFDAVTMFVNTPGSIFQKDSFYPLAWWQGEEIVIHKTCSLNYAQAIRKAASKTNL